MHAAQQGVPSQATQPAEAHGPKLQRCGAVHNTESLTGGAGVVEGCAFCKCTSHTLARDRRCREPRCSAIMWPCVRLWSVAKREPTIIFADFRKLFLVCCSTAHTRHVLEGSCAGAVRCWFRSGSRSLLADGFEAERPSIWPQPLSSVMRSPAMRKPI